MKTEKIDAAKEVLLDCLGGYYYPEAIYGYRSGSRQERMAEYVGLESSNSDYSKTALTLRQLRRLTKLCDRCEINCPAWIGVAIDERDDRRRNETTSRRESDGETLTIRGNFVEASSSISAKWGDGEWFGTPFQVADARHGQHAACLLVAKWGG